MNNISDFIIENGELKSYVGNEKEVLIPDCVTIISSRAFANCLSVTSITIPDSVVSIDSSVFRGCLNLRNVLLSGSVSSIGDYAFCDCSSLAYINLPSSLTTIGKGAFYGCFCIKSIFIPENVVSISSSAFRECASLEKVVISDSVMSMGESIFFNCTSLTDVKLPAGLKTLSCEMFFNCGCLPEIVIPASVETIENGAFAFCDKLHTITFEGNKASLTAAAVIECRKLSKIQFPEDYFCRREKCGTSMLPFMESASDREAAYIWMFQDDKYMAWLLQKKPDVNLMAEELMVILKDTIKYTPKVIKRIIEFISYAYAVIGKETVQAICDIVAANDTKTAKKLLQDENVQKALSSECVIEEKEPIEIFAADFAEQHPLHPKACVFTKGIPFVGKEKLCSPELLNLLVSEYLYLYDIYREYPYGNESPVINLSLPIKTKLPEAADRIAEALDVEALSQALEKLVYTCSGYRPWMYAYARFATEESVDRLIHHPPSGTAAKVRSWRENLTEALLLSETKAAVDHLEKKGFIVRYAHMRNMSVQEFRDKHSMPKWDMDENRVIRSKYGRLGYVVTDDLELSLYELDSGKQLRSVSAKTDPEASQEFKLLKKEVSDFYKKRIAYIKSIYISAEHISIQHWRDTYYGNSILRPISEKVIWCDSKGETFMIVDGLLKTVTGALYEPKEWVTIAHALEMKPEKISAWQEQLQLLGKKLLIEQVWEPLAVIDNIDAFTNVVLSKDERNDLKRALSRKAIEIKCESDYSEFDHRANRYIFSNTGTMHIGSVLNIEYEVDENTDETRLLSFDCLKSEMTREINSVLFELTRVCIMHFIVCDDTQMLIAALASGYTAAQIIEFVRLAQKAGSVNSLAILMQHKNTNYESFDPMSEFTLDY